jgi:hypothetical protein
MVLVYAMASDHTEHPTHPCGDAMPFVLQKYDALHRGRGKLSLTAFTGEHAEVNIFKKIMNLKMEAAWTSETSIIWPNATQGGRPRTKLRKKKRKHTPWVYVRKRNILTERMPFVGEVSDDFCG